MDKKKTVLYVAALLGCIFAVIVYFEHTIAGDNERIELAERDRARDMLDEFLVGPYDHFIKYRLVVSGLVSCDVESVFHVVGSLTRRDGLLTVTKEFEKISTKVSVNSSTSICEKLAVDALKTERVQFTAKIGDDNRSVFDSETKELIYCLPSGSSKTAYCRGIVDGGSISSEIEDDGCIKYSESGAGIEGHGLMCRNGNFRDKTYPFYVVEKTVDGLTAVLSSYFVEGKQSQSLQTAK